MQSRIEKIVLTRDVRKARNLPVEDNNTDVIVTMSNGDLFLASFYSYESIDLLKRKHAKSKEFLSGKYFWAKGLLLIDNCHSENIKIVVNHIFEEGDFLEAFVQIL